jgi:hypothetical protein
MPFMGESARDISREVLANVQGYYFIIAPAIKANTVPAYSIIFRKQAQSEFSRPKETDTANEYYITMNILTDGFQSVVIQQQSTQYIDPEEQAHSEDDESSQFKQSKRYKKGVMQFIQNFKPPSKKGRGDDSSSIGTGVSLDTQEEDIDESSMRRRIKKPTRQVGKINTSSLAAASLGAPSAEASEIGSSVGVGVVQTTAEKKQKRPPRMKGKGPSINISSLVFPSEEEREGEGEGERGSAATAPTTAVSVEPSKKPRVKKLNIAPLKLSQLPRLPKGQQLLGDEVGLSDIREVSDEERDES